MYVNSVVQVGNLTGDPEAGSPDNGTVANFRIAVGNEKKDEDGKVVSGRVDFIDVECWGVQGQNCLDTLKKGDRVILVGLLVHDRWEADDGTKHSKHNIKAKTVGKSLEFAGA